MSSPRKASDNQVVVSSEGLESPASSVHHSIEKSHGTFATSGLDEFFRPVASYEGAHRYDPSFEWDQKEESRIVRKLDARICSWACLCFFALQLDRGNVNQALTDSLLNDLHMTTNDYNTGQTIFFLFFLAAELPSQMISKRLGPDNWIPIQMVSWSLVACCQTFCTNKTSWFVLRALLGTLEGGFIPDTVLYLSYFYKSSELPRRLSFFWTSYMTTYIISAFLAYGILHLRGVNGLAGWQWLFALEGTLTGLIGVITYFYLPPSPTQTASWFRGKQGWFTEHEEKIMVNRVLRDDPSKGDMHNRQGITLRMLWDCLKDVDMWPLYFIGLIWMIPFYPAQQYLTLEIRALGFGTFETNLLSIPAYVIFIVNLLFWTALSEIVNERFLVGTATQWWCLPILIALEVLPSGDQPHLLWGRYVCFILVYGAPYVHAIFVSITSRNAGSVSKRTVASAIYNMAVQVSNIVGSNIYRTPDAPLYRTGNKVLLALVAFNIVAIVLAKAYYMWRNKQKAHAWDQMSQEQKKHYLSTTTDTGSHRLDFRFTH